MYQVDGKDKVKVLGDLPQSSVGAPIPFVLSDEGTVVLAYYLQENTEGWDGTSVRLVDPQSEEMPVAIVRFVNYQSYMFGPPNDEAFDGHPLANKGLERYAVHVVENSSWLRKLEEMNRVHPHHDPASYHDYSHYIFAFHDSTFECIAKNFELTIVKGSIQSAVPGMIKHLNWE